MRSTRSSRAPVRRDLLFAGAAAAAIAVALLLVHDHTRGDSLSADEPVHILAGYLQVASRTAIVNIEHPPLMKELAGLALRALPLPPPPVRIPMGTSFTTWGHAFLFEGPVSPDAIASAARAPFLVVFGALLVLVFCSARSRFGGAAALFAVTLLAFDPNLGAHAGIVHTDLGAALAFFAAVLAWDAAERERTIIRVTAAGVVLGLALLTKFSCVYLLPILLLQSLFALYRTEKPGRELALLAGRFSAAGAIALGVVIAVYAIVTANMDLSHQRQVIHEMVAGRGGAGLSRIIESVAQACPPLGHYLGGLASVYRQNAVGGGVNYLFGQASVHGFPSYFFVAFLVKSTLAFLAATAIALAALVRDARARGEAALFLLPPAVLFLASMGASYNIGIRHLLPVFPFLAMAAAGALARVRERPRGGFAASRAAGVALVLLPLLSAGEILRIHPHELSYFNPLVGGPEGGRRILSDSNVDWGLDLRRLADELSRRGVSDPTVVYFGGDDVLYRVGVPEFAADPVVRGRLVAISAFAEALGPEFYAYHGAPLVSGALERLRRDIARTGRPAGRVGYSIHLYELPPKGTTAP